MSVDFSKFAFPGVEDPHADTLAAGIRSGPVSSGFVVVLATTDDTDGFTAAARHFATALRADAEGNGLVDISAYRHVRPDELGGAVPFDQAICEDALRTAEQVHAAEPDRFPAIPAALTMARENELADWVLLVEFETTDRAATAAASWKRGGPAFAGLTENTTSHIVCAFENTMRYAGVSRDPGVIQFFNLFPGPGDPELLWKSWQEALPWFLETGEIRSSFPMVALEPDQEILLVNYAHCDSFKHFFLGVCYDPNFVETSTRCYSGRGFVLPKPFFCKIVPV